MTDSEIKKLLDQFKENPEVIKNVEKIKYEQGKTYEGDELNVFTTSAQFASILELGILEGEERKEVEEELDRLSDKTIKIANEVKNDLIILKKTRELVNQESKISDQTELEMLSEITVFEDLVAESLLKRNEDGSYAVLCSIPRFFDRLVNLAPDIKLKILVDYLRKYNRNEPYTEKYLQREFSKVKKN